METVSNKANLLVDPESMNFLVEYRGDIENEVKDIENVEVYIIDGTYAVLSMKNVDYDSVIQMINSLVFIELGGIYTLSSTSPIEASKAENFHNSPYLKLTGEDVIVGIIDTGIDYLNNEFMREDETTRILRIWDQTIDSGKTPDGFISGSEYTEEDMNKAIQAQKQGQNPYDIVPSKDDYGHGTKMAGIVGARGINREIVGVAPDCEFIIIKLQEASKEYVDFYYAKGDKAKYRNTDIIMALKYLYELSFTLNKPMIIYLPLGSNLGDHAGASILERYVDTKISGRNSLFVVTSTGNQGNTDTHTSGEIKSNGDSQIIELICSKA